MNSFYRCPQCKGTDFNFTKYPDIYCRPCKSYEVVQAMSFNEISRSLDDNNLFYFSEKKPVIKPREYYKPLPPTVKQQDMRIGEGRGVLGEGWGNKEMDKKRVSF